MDTDERIRRLEARIVSGDRALQRQAENVMALAARRAERTAAWGVLALSGAAVLVALDVWFTRRRAPVVPAVRRARALDVGRREPHVASLLQLLPVIGVVWRAVSQFSARGARDPRGY